MNKEYEAEEGFHNMFCIYCMEKHNAHIQEEKELRKDQIHNR